MEAWIQENTWVFRLMFWIPFIVGLTVVALAFIRMLLAWRRGENPGRTMRRIKRSRRRSFGSGSRSKGAGG